LVDEDTHAFNKIMDAFALPKKTDEEKATRKLAIEAATVYAIEVPLKVMQSSLESFETIAAMAHIGNPNSVSDAGVGAICARAAVYGAYLNVKINASGLADKAIATDYVEKAKILLSKAFEQEKIILAKVEDIINS